MRVIKNPKKKKNEILDVAETLFITKGYSKTTINDILQSIGIAKGTFYYYFKSKEEVMNAVITRYVDAGADFIRQVADDKSLTIQEKFVKILLTENKSENPNEIKVLTELHQAENAKMHQKSIAESALKVAPIITEIVGQGISEGIFNTPYPKESSEFLLLSFQSLYDSEIFPWKREEILVKIKALTYIAEKVLGAEEGSFSDIPKMFNKMFDEEINL